MGTLSTMTTYLEGKLAKANEVRIPDEFETL